MSKEKQIEEITKFLYQAENDMSGILICNIESLAEKFYAADFCKQSKGEWILEREPNGKPYCFHCSACGVDMIKVASNYCPNCGAKMKGGAE